jgi:hypothetical protein
MLERRRQSTDNPKLSLGLDGYLHPSLQGQSKLLEYSVLRLKYGVEVVLQRHGKHVVEHQLDLKRLADSAIDVYAMTAVLSRASRLVMANCLLGLRERNLCCVVDERSEV